MSIRNITAAIGVAGLLHGLPQSPYYREQQRRSPAEKRALANKKARRRETKRRRKQRPYRFIGKQAKPASPT